MREVYVVSTCDEWHSNASKLTIGVYEYASDAIDDLAIKYKLSEDNQELLGSCGQTQGLEQNFIIDRFVLNRFQY